MRLLKRLPKEDYDKLVAGCDVGMLFLDHRFTIPNFPSRLLSYMQAGLPVLACTDPNTDVGKVITEGGFGWWCESNDTDAFAKAVSEACVGASQKGDAAYEYLCAHYSVEEAASIVLKSMT
jgi:glycosyltransferase involved in cell wall biosynthesis